MRWWLVREAKAMGVSNTSIAGMDYSTLAETITHVGWRDGKGELQRVGQSGIRENFLDMQTPVDYLPFFKQFLRRLPNIALWQGKKVVTDLIEELFDSKRQAPIYYPIAAGAFWWDADDHTLANMAIATIPEVFTGTSGSLVELVNQINTRIADTAEYLRQHLNINVVGVYNGWSWIAANNPEWGATGADTINNRMRLNQHTKPVWIGTSQVNIPSTGAQPGLSGQIPWDQTAILRVDISGSSPSGTILPVGWTPRGHADPVGMWATEMAGLMTAIYRRRIDLLRIKVNKSNAVNALADMNAVIDYDVAAGWPT